MLYAKVASCGSSRMHAQGIQIFEVDTIVNQQATYMTAEGLLLSCCRRVCCTPIDIARIAP